jgi:hypothetical protein
MSKGLFDDQEALLAKFEQSSRQMEARAVELVDAGRALFKDGEPTGSHLQRRYRLYSRGRSAATPQDCAHWISFRNLGARHKYMEFSPGKNIEPPDHRKATAAPGGPLTDDELLNFFMLLFPASADARRQRA